MMTIVVVIVIATATVSNDTKTNEDHYCEHVMVTNHSGNENENNTVKINVKQANEKTNITNLF